jgi:invasion protein IalB
MAKMSSVGVSRAAAQSEGAGVAARVRRLRRALVATLAAGAAVAFLAAPAAQAQAQPKPKPAPKAAPKQPVAPQAQAQQPAAPAQPQMPKFVSSPWTKLCETQPKKLCVTRALLLTETGSPAALAEFAEPEGSPKILRVTLPLGMLLEYGTRLLIDQEQQPYVTGKFVVCLEGCITFYPVSDDLQQKLKAGKTLYIQAVNINNAPMSFPLPLTNFAKALDGAPTDPKVYAEQQKKFQEELQKQHPAPPKQ